MTLAYLPHSCLLLPLFYSLFLQQRLFKSLFVSTLLLRACLIIRFRAHSGSTRRRTHDCLALQEKKLGKSLFNNCRLLPSRGSQSWIRRSASPSTTRSRRYLWKICRCCTCRSIIDIISLTLRSRACRRKRWTAIWSITRRGSGGWRSTRLGYTSHCWRGVK